MIPDILLRVSLTHLLVVEITSFISYCRNRDRFEKAEQYYLWANTIFIKLLGKACLSFVLHWDSQTSNSETRFSSYR